MANILLLDPNTIDQTGKAIFSLLDSWCLRTSSTCTTARQGSITPEQYGTSWDMILIPFVDGGFANDYNNIATELPNFTDPDIPVCILQAHSPGVASGVTGVTSTGGPTNFVVDTIASAEWENRTNFTEAGYFCDPVSSTGFTGTAIFSDSVSGSIAVWRNDIDSRPTLFIAGYSQSDDQVSKVFKPWMAFQWMIDKQSTPAKSTAVRNSIRKAVVQIWLDGFDDSTTVSNFSDVETMYSDAVSQSFNEIMVGAFSNGAGLPGDNNAVIAEWFADRDRSNGGLFRHTNHHTALPAATSDNSGGTRDPGVTTDGVTLDNINNGETSFNASTVALRGPFNGGSSTIQLGDDGSGAGDPYVSFTNYGNVPAAQYLNGKYRYFALSISLNGANNYPSDAFGTAATFAHTELILWEGTPTYGRINIDPLNNNDADKANTLNDRFYNAAAFGGGLYIHPNELNEWNGYSSVFYDYYNMAPDILAGDWDTLSTYINDYTGYVPPISGSPVLTGSVKDNTTLTPQREGVNQNFGQGDVAPQPVTVVGGLSSSILGVCTNEGQDANSQRVFSEDQSSDHTATLIGGGGTGGVDGSVPNSPLEIVGASDNISDKHIRYETATASDVVPDAAFPNTYLNKTYPAETVEQDGAAFSVEP